MCMACPSWTEDSARPVLSSTKALGLFPAAANERTFLAWLSMAVTIGSVSAALVGFTASENDGRGGALIAQLLVHACLTNQPCIAKLA